MHIFFQMYSKIGAGFIFFNGLLTCKYFLFSNLIMIVSKCLNCALHGERLIIKKTINVENLFKGSSRIVDE